jgi:hypothetical protein
MTFDDAEVADSPAAFKALMRTFKPRRLRK